MDEKTRKWLIERDQIVNAAAEKFHANVNIVITAHSSQRMFMEACIDSVKPAGWLLMVYDKPKRDFLKNLPSEHCFKQLDQFFMKHETHIIPGPTYPQFWNYKHGLDICMGSKSEFVFTIGADSILERPEGMPEIVEMLGKGDILACSTRNPDRHRNAYCNTKSFLIRKRAFQAIMNYLETETYVPMQNIGNMEYRFGLAIRDLQLDEVVVPELPAEDQFAYGYDEDGNSIDRGTWGKILGFRHLGGEHKIRRLQKLRPIEEKYFDKKHLRSQELRTISKYWETGDWKHVEDWWET